MDKNRNKQFAFIVNGEKKEVNAKCSGKAVKMILAEYPQLRKEGIQTIKLIE